MSKSPTQYCAEPPHAVGGALATIASTFWTPIEILFWAVVALLMSLFGIMMLGGISLLSLPFIAFKVFRRSSEHAPERS